MTGSALQGRRVGSGPPGVTDDGRDQAPRTEAPYTCDRPGCPFRHFTVPFADDAVWPLVWRCRCGSPATLDGAEPGPELDAARDEMVNGPHKERSAGTEPMAQLMKREKLRKPGHGEKLLAERLAQVRATGAAR